MIQKMGRYVLIVMAFSLILDRTAPSSKAFAHSVAHAVGGSTVFNDEHCALEKRGDFVCWMSDKSGSGGAEYRVNAIGHRCWEAKLVRDSSESREMPRHSRGCVTFYNRARLGDRLLSML